MSPKKSIFKFSLRNVTFDRDVSDNCHPVSVFGKAAENTGKFENVTRITVLKGDQYFSEKVVSILCTSSSTLRINLLFNTNQMKLKYMIQFNNSLIFHRTR